MTNGNDAAYSRAGFALNTDDYDFGSEGLTKREYFAAMAMQGLLSCNAMYKGSTAARLTLACDAAAHADALITALNEESK